MMNYTPEQINEMGKCLDDVSYFCRNYVFINHPVQGKILFNPFEEQENLLKRFDSNFNNVIKHTRQAGVGTCMAAYALWYAIFKPFQTVGFVAPILKNSRELIDKVRMMYEDLPEWLRPETLNCNKSMIEFDNKSRIFTDYIGCTAFKGMSMNLIFVDMMAYATKTKQAEFWETISPLFHYGIKMNIASGINKPGDTFCNIWDEAVANPLGNFRPFFISWWVGNRDEAFKEQTIKMIGEKRWKREYESVL